MQGDDTTGATGPETPTQPTGRRGVRERWQAMSRRRRVLAMAALAGPLLLVLGLLTVVYFATTVPLPENVGNAQISVITYSGGGEFARVGAENRKDVPLSKVSKAAQHAVLAAENRDFYSDPGISLKGIVRAAWANVRGRSISQGASTITQQYAKNAYLSQERTFSRKMQEVVLAVKLDRSYSKDQVLEFYLNTVYFGRGAYGIEVAAETYFGKHASELTAGEGAVLAALLRSPATYDPARNPERAKERWAYVLRGMASKGWLEGAPDAQAYPAVRPRSTRGNALAGQRGYLVQQVLDELERAGVSEAQINAAGLRIETTLDKEAQAAAVSALQQTTGAAAPPGVHRALVAVEPGTGRIRAEYAGDDYVQRPFNDATQGIAQAGSSFKPYVLAAALANGISLKSTFDGRSPQTFGDYPVRNYGPGSGEQFGVIDLVEATAHSVNTIYVPLGEQAGLGEVADTAAALGIRADMRKERALPSISLGVTAVHPIDQAAAYATLAARGVYGAPYIVERVTDRDGNVVYAAEPKTRRVLPEPVVDDVTFALQAVVQRGTGTRAQLDGRPAAGKTGTTTGNTAAWFVGYTPQLATAVGLFSDRQDVPLREIAGVPEVTGGTLPARTWKRFMEVALEGQPVRRFPPPAYVGGAPSPSASPTTTATATATATATPTAGPTLTLAPAPTYTYQPPQSSPPPPNEEPSGPPEEYTPPPEPTPTSTTPEQTGAQTTSKRKKAEPTPTG